MLGFDFMKDGFKSEMEEKLKQYLNVSSLCLGVGGVGGGGRDEAYLVI